MLKLMSVATMPGLTRTDRPTDRPTDWLTDWPTDRRIDRPTDRPTHRPADRPTDRPTERASDRPTDRPAGRTDGRTDGHVGVRIERPAFESWPGTLRFQLLGKAFYSHSASLHTEVKWAPMNCQGILTKSWTGGRGAARGEWPVMVYHINQSIFIYTRNRIIFYMVFLGIVFKTRLKYSKKLLTKTLRIQKLTLWIIRATMGHGVLEKSFPWNEVVKTFKVGSFLISEGILFHRTDPL